MTFEQYKRFEHLGRLCDDHGIEGLINNDGSGLSPDEMACRLYAQGYIPEPSIEAMLNEFEKIVLREMGEKVSPEDAGSSEWLIEFILADPKGIPISEDAIRRFQRQVCTLAVQNGFDIRNRKGKSLIPEDMSES